MYPVEIRYRPLGGADDVGAERGRRRGRRSRRRSSTTAEDLWRERSRRHPRVPSRRARDPRDRRPRCAARLARRPYARARRDPAAVSRACRCRSSSASSRRRAAGASCSRPTSPRPRSPCPGIRYVIDAGLARVKRYNAAQQDDAAADREDLAGRGEAARGPLRPRAGRHLRAPVRARRTSRRGRAYTDPEILRSSLASVILRMAALDLGAVDAFPFVEPPTPRAIADGYQLLQELGAVDDARALTPLGRELARLPLDPRIGRIVLAARDARLPRRSAGHRERAVGARSARASARASSRPPTRRTCASATSAPISCRWSRCGSSSTTLARRSSRIASSSTPAARSSCSSCGCSNGATCTASSRASSRKPGWKWDADACRRRSTTRATRRCTRRCSRACSATSALRRRGRRRLPRRARPALLPAPGLGTREEARRSGCSPPSSSRRRACTRAARRRSSPSGSRRSPAIA